jgi:hypothetical protein
MTDWRGDWISAAFPYHEHRSADLIKANVHPNCRCYLRYAGNFEEYYNDALETKLLKTWHLSKRELDSLTVEQLNYALKFLRNPYLEPNR